MQQLIKMGKEELLKLSSEQKKKKAIKDIKEILSKDKRFVSAKVAIKFKEKELKKEGFKNENNPLFENEK